MSRIDIENQKTLRPAMKVICGLDVERGDVSSVGATNSYDDRVGSLTSVEIPNIYMDLSNGGFANDGNAVPLSTSHAGIVSKLNNAMVLTIHLSSSVSVGIPISVYGYEGEVLKKWTSSTISGNTQTITIEASAKRTYITKVNIGESWWFDNTNLISCNVQLRGIETTLDNPSLQMSEIEIKGYEPNDITSLIDKVDENNPIYYSAGYINDMSPVRKFYLNGMLEWEKNVITIKGADATKFLEGEYAEYSYGEPFIPSTYRGLIKDILDDAGIDYTSIGSEATVLHPLLVPKMSKRDFIAQTCNLIRGQVTTDGSGHTIGYDYIDAGRPTFKVWTPPSRANIKTLENIADLKTKIEKKTKGISVNITNPISDTTQSEITTADVPAGTTSFIETSEPYRDFTPIINSGNASWGRLTPYKSRFTATENSNVTLKGACIRDTVPTMDSSWIGPTSWTSPLVINYGEYGQILDLGDIHNIAQRTYNDKKFSVIYNLLSYIPSTPTASGFSYASERSNISYEFTYRGDPRLQPRDLIKVQIEGVDTIMTIDNLTLEHEGGGLKSKIVARKGVI